MKKFMISVSLAIFAALLAGFAQAAVLPQVNVLNFGAKCDGATDDSGAFQKAVNSLNALNGGEVDVPNAQCSLGTTGIQTYSQITIRGVAQPYVSTSARGAVLLYSGTGNAIYGTNVTNVVLENISIDASGSTGASVNGIYLKGSWLATLRNVRVKGVTPAKGFGILIDTNSGTFGGQHNELQKVEVPDGIIRLSGTSGSDEVTTTVFNTVRGNQYQINNSQVVAINSTVGDSTWTGKGWDFQGASDGLLIHCDIEGGGVGDIGINVGGTSIVRELGTTWNGFTGTTRVSGALGNYQMYGNQIALADSSISAGNLFNSAIMWGQAPVGGTPDFVEIAVRANAVNGGTQDGNLEISRRIAGAARINQFEWRNQFKIENSKSIGNVATTVLTIPVTTNTGVRVKTTAWGIQTGAGAFSISRETNAVNDLSAGITKSDLAANLIASGGATPVITYTISGLNLLVQFNHGSGTSSLINFIIEIDGPITGYTKG